MSVDSYFSEDEIQAMKAGQPVAKSYEDTPKGVVQRQPSIGTSTSSAGVSEWSGANPDIQRVTTQVSQPNLTTADGMAIPTQRVSGPSKGFAEALGQAEMERRAEEEKRNREEREELRKRSPGAMNDRISYLERQVKKLTTKLNKLEKASDG